MMGYFILMILVLMPGVWSGDWGVTLQRQCALKGTSVVIKCEYAYPSGHTVTGVNWLKVRLTKTVRLSDLPSPPDFEYMGNKHGNCDLKIKSVQHRDEGKYYFSFETNLGTWESSTYLTVRDDHLCESDHCEGYNVRLSCQSGCSSLAIVWFRDGQRVQISQFSARREDAGKYQCAVLGQETARSASVALNVHYAPKNVKLSISSPSDIVTGSSVTFTCSCEANPPVTHEGYRLYKDGGFVSLGLSHTFSDIQPIHSGLYHCRAKNHIRWKGINSAEIHLDVKYAPKNVKLSISSPADIIRGSSVTFTCSCEANPPVTHEGYRLYKDGGLVSLGLSHTISDIQPSHSGLYHCQAWNNIRWMGTDTVNSTEIHLDVQYAPKNVKLSISLTADIIRGSSLTFTCSCEANPPVTHEGYRLYKDGGLVSLGQNHTISEIQPSHSGLYHCQARNNIRWMGTDTVYSAEIHLDVKYAPKNVKLSIISPTDIIRGSSVTFTCSCEANPPVTHEGYKLYKDGGLVSLGQNHTISEIQPSHSGLYHCQAWNNIRWMGTDTVYSTEIHLDVQYEPMNVLVSVEPQQVAEGGSVNLTCSSEANPAADNYTWYSRRTHSANSNSMVQVGSGQMLFLQSVEASHSGLYVCQARNSVGENNSTEVRLTVERMDQGGQSHRIIARLAGLIVVVALLTALILSWKKLRECTEKNAVSGSSLEHHGLSSSVKEDQLDNVYANIAVSSSPSLNPTSDEADVVYSTVIIKHKATNAAPPIKSKAAAEEDSVIYATVAKSRGSRS